MYFVTDGGQRHIPVLSVIIQRVLLALFVISSVVGLSRAPYLQDENRLDRFVPPRADMDAVERRFRGAFGSDLYLPIAVHLDHPIGEEDEKQLEAFFQAVSALPGVQKALTPFSLSGRLLDFSLDDQLQLHNADRTTYSALFVLDPNQQRHDFFLNTLDTVREQYLGPAFEVAIGGEPEVNGWLTREGKRLKEGILPLAALVGVVVLFLRLPTMRLRAIVGTTVVLALGNGMLPLVLSGQSMHLLLLLVPLLSAVIALAGSIHILVGHRTRVATIEESRQLRRQKIEATFYCFLTTAIGFGSLATSPIPAIRDLGLLAGSGVFLAGLTVLIALPQFLNWWAPWGDLALATERRLAPSGIWAWVGILTVGASYVLFPALQTEMRAIHYFGAQHPVQRALRRLERDFLPMRSYEVMIEGQSSTLADVDLAAALADVTGVERVLDGELPGFPTFAEEGRLRRATVFVSDAALANPTRLQDDIRGAVSEAAGERSRVFLVGILTHMISAQQAIHATLKRSLLITSIALMLLFAFLTRSVIGTFAAFIANAFPLAGLVILQYLLALPLDLGIVLTYSVCLGLAVDDTLHLVFDMKKLGGVSAEAITKAEVRCGPGIYESSWILAAGFAFLALSEFLPVRHFGVLAAAGVVLALVGDMVIFPSIVTHFLGHFSFEVQS